MNGWLMSRDTIVAEIKDQVVKPVRESLLPFYFLQPVNDLREWLTLRALDTQRANSRLVRKRLGLSDASPAQLALAVNAATITEEGWRQPHLEGCGLPAQ